MTEVYVNVKQVCYVEETDIGVEICMTTGERLAVTQSITEVMEAFDDEDGSFYYFTRCIPLVRMN